MAGESERIGGISVGASVDDSGVEAQLNALLAKMQAKAEQMEKALTIKVRAAGGQASSSRGSAGGSGPSTIHLDSSKFEAKIDALIAALGKYAGSGVAEPRQGRPDASRVATDHPIQVVTSSQERAYQRTEDRRRRANQVATAKAQAEDEAPKEARRKPLRDRSEGTAVRSDTVYTYDPEVENRRADEAEARSRREGRAILDRRARAEDVDQMRMLTRIFTNLDEAGERGQTRIDAQRLQSLSDQNASANAGGGAPTSDLPLRTQASRAAYESEQRAREEASRRRQASNAGRSRGASQAPPPPEDPRSSTEREQARKAAERENVAAGRAGELRDRQTELRLRRSAFNRRIQEANIERIAAQRIASQEAQITAAGRTSRTTASALAGFFGGPRRQQIEAQSELDAARQNRVQAQRYRSVFEDEIIRREVAAQTATKSRAKALRDEIAVIKARPDYAKAIEEETAALDRESTATERVTKLSQGFGTAARSLAAVTIGGAAFGLGLKAIDTALAVAIPALGRMVDEQTGLGASSARVTAELAKQTAQMRGSTEAALLAAEAQAGIGTSATAALNAQLRLPVQIKAGAQAQAQASDLYRAAAGAPNAPSGLFGGYGGVGGTALLAEQLGGGKGYLETFGGDVKALTDMIAQGQRTSTVNPLANGPIGLIQGLLPSNEFAERNPAWQQIVEPTQQAMEAAKAASTSLDSLVKNFNEAAGRGAVARGEGPTGLSIRPIRSGEDVSSFRTASMGISSEAASFADDLRRAGLVVQDASGAIATLPDAIKRFYTQSAVGTGVPDIETLGAASLAAERQRQRESQASLPALLAQQAFARTGVQNAIERAFQRQLTQENPAQAALSNLTNPILPSGTGIAGRNAAEQAKINAGLKESVGLQTDLNSYYAVGRQILQQTYQIPGPLMQSLVGVSNQIASIQAGLSNQQAAYQTAQYNFQLFVAKRTLGDIAGLTGHAFGVPATELGTLERANLLLGRQAQQLQFILSQRQINFNRAVAGFTVPGLTPAEQNARVREAKIEADFAQKQLDIQRKMFANQVKIVDISNLRQGADLVKQIALLRQGRALDIDTRVAQEKLDRLNRKQAALIADAQAYISKANAQISAREQEIQQVEAATGKAIDRLTLQGIDAAWKVGHAFFVGMTGGFLGGGGNGGGAHNGGGDGNSRYGSTRSAQGNIFSTTGTTSLGPYGIAGEAADETVVVMRDPRRLNGAAMGGGSGGDVYVSFGDVTVRSDADIDALVRKITQAQGRTAAIKGMRGAN